MWQNLQVGFISYKVWFPTLHVEIKSRDLKVLIKLHPQVVWCKWLGWGPGAFYRTPSYCTYCSLTLSIIPAL